MWQLSQASVAMCVSTYGSQSAVAGRGVVAVLAAAHGALDFGRHVDLRTLPAGEDRGRAAAGTR